MSQTHIPYGRRHVLTVIQDLAHQPSSRPFSLIPKTADPADGFTEIGYPALLRAIDRAAFFLDENVGKAADGDTFAWIAAPADVRYLIFALAAMKTGHRAFFPSPRNSLEVHTALFERTHAVALVHPSTPRDPVVSNILAICHIKDVVAPGLEALLEPTEEAHPIQYPFRKTFEEVRLQPFLILHTSGSTGIPKPIVIKHAAISVLDALHLLPSLGLGPSAMGATGGTNQFNPLPNFHMIGLLAKIGLPTFWGTTTVESPNAPLTADLELKFIEHPLVETAWMPPSISREVAFDSESLKKLSKVKYVISGGAPMSEEVIKMVRNKAPYLNTIGTTEAIVYANEMTDPEDIDYLKLSEKLGYRFDPVDGDLYELVLERKPELQDLQGIFITFPDLDEFHTKDTFSKHPEKPDLWIFRGRLDDVVVLDNGEKFNPISMQQHIETHHDIVTALVDGTGHFQPCLIIEPREPVQSDEEKVRLIDRVWPVIEEANQANQAHGRVHKEFVLIADHHRPFIRTSKATIQRKASLGLYKKEMDDLYSQMDIGTSATTSVSGSGLQSLDAASLAVRRLLSDLGIELESDDADFFSNGVDSMQVVNLGRGLRTATGNPNIQPRIIYSHPSIRKLARAIIGSGNQTASVPIQLTKVERMDGCLAEHSRDLPINARLAVARPSKDTILMTGSTGSLGSYILDVLLQNARIDKVICLNRTEDAEARQLTSMNNKGLTADFSRVEFLRIDFAAEYLGLEPDTYRRLLKCSTHILHNAWPVDFNQSLDSFQPHIALVRRLVDFSAHSLHGAHIYFVSSIASILGSKTVPVPEEIFTDFDMANASGYGESKLVSEVLLSRAAACRVPCSVARLGQIAGPVNHGEKGVWNRHEWLPTLIASSIHMGALPESLRSFDTVDYVPVDVVAESLVELLLSGDVGESSQSCRMHHIINPRTVSWPDLRNSVLEVLPEAKRPRLVPYSAWIVLLRKAAEGSDEATLHHNPAIKLLDFYASLESDESSVGSKIKSAQMATAETTKVSTALRNCKPVNAAWMELWMRQWAF